MGTWAITIPRSELLDEGQEFAVVVDAANTPEQLASMLDAAREGGARQVRRGGCLCAKEEWVWGSRGGRRGCGRDEWVGSAGFLFGERPAQGSNASRRAGGWIGRCLHLRLRHPQPPPPPAMPLAEHLTRQHLLPPAASIDRPTLPPRPSRHRPQIFTVFGCSGNEDAALRPKMGAVAHAKSDYVILTNENPRQEDPAKIMQVSHVIAYD